MNNISFDMPVEYSITVQGVISPRLKESFGKTRILIIDENEDEGNTIIKILVKDQAHLIGILKSLFEARFVILNIKSLASI